MTVEPYTVLCLDPGISNYAWSALRVSPCGFKYKLIGSGHLHSGIKTPDPHSIEKYEREIQHLICAYLPRYVVAERYQYRGPRSAGARNIEPINMMLGVLSSVCSYLGTLCYFPTPAQWKKWRNKQTGYDDYGIDEVKRFASDWSDKTGITPTEHMVDSMTIGYWWSEVGFKANVDLDWASVCNHAKWYKERGPAGPNYPFGIEAKGSMLEDLLRSLVGVGGYYRNHGTTCEFGYLKSQLTNWRGDTIWVLPKAKSWTHMEGTVVTPTTQKKFSLSCESLIT